MSLSIAHLIYSDMSHKFCEFIETGKSEDAIQYKMTAINNPGMIFGYIWVYSDEYLKRNQNVNIIESQTPNSFAIPFSEAEVIDVDNPYSLHHELKTRKPSLKRENAHYGYGLLDHVHKKQKTI